jgi:hypothetical protein
MGRLGLAGFLTAFSGTYLIAVTGNFGFLAPVLAKQSPAVLESINQYVPVVVINGLAAILFMIAGSVDAITAGVLLALARHRSGDRARELKPNLFRVFLT